MKVIKSVLKEELANSLAMKKNYERELAKLPKGSLVKKTIKGHESTGSSYQQGARRFNKESVWFNASKMAMCR